MFPLRNLQLAMGGKAAGTHMVGHWGVATFHSAERSQSVVLFAKAITRGLESIGAILDVTTRVPEGHSIHDTCVKSRWCDMHLVSQRKASPEATTGVL